MEPNVWKDFFRSYVLGQWYCYIFNMIMILKNNNQDLNWYWNALWLSSHSFWKLRNCIQASKWKKSCVGVQVFACDVAVESDHVVIRNSRSQFKTTSSSRKSKGDFTPCGVKILQCLSTSLTKIHSARATGGGGRLPRAMKVAWWRRWGQNRAISYVYTSLVLFCGHFPNKNKVIRTSNSDALWTCCANCSNFPPGFPQTQT